MLSQTPVGLAQTCDYGCLQDGHLTCVAHLVTVPALRQHCLTDAQTEAQGRAAPEAAGSGQTLKPSG